MEVSGYPLARRQLSSFGDWTGAIVAGGTLTLAAQPVDEAYVSDWGNSECNNQGKGDPSRPGERIECVLTPKDHLSMNVSFTFPELVGPTVFLLPTENGTLSANRDDDPVIEDGETVPEGATVRFQARPAEGYYASRWTGDCAGRTAGHSGRTGPSAVAGCGILDVTTNVTVGVEFSRPRRVSLSHSAGGTLTARSLPGLTRVFNGGVVDDGATVSVTATPDSGYEISMWSGDCDGTAKTEADCILTATVHLSASVSFSDINECAAATHNCAADGGVCENTPGAFVCECAEGYSGDGRACEADGEADKTTAFSSGENGSLSANPSGSPVPHGTTVTFTATPDSGYEISMWSGDCDGTAKTESDCVLTATVHLSASVSFSDINECAAATHNCAADGGVCENTPGDFVCECAEGYSGDGRACEADGEADKTTAFSSGENGSLSANPGGSPVPHGTTVTFTATPDSGYEISMWSGDCDGTAKTESDCVLTATVHLSASVSFSDIDECATATHNCAADGGVCENTPGAFACECASDYSGDGFSCAPVRTVSLSHSPGGTLSAGWSGDAAVADGETVPYGAVVTFTATPADEIKISLWSGGCAGASSSATVCVLTATVALDVAVEFFADCAGRFRVAGADAYSRCGDCLAEYGEMGGGHCVHLQDAPTENRMTCEEVFGGDWEAAGDSAGVCSGIDINDTFCFLGVADALPCQGLFLHVRDCNLKHNRPALDPWHCGKACADGKAVGAWCLGSE